MSTSVTERVFGLVGVMIDQFRQYRARAEKRAAEREEWIRNNVDRRLKEIEVERAEAERKGLPTGHLIREKLILLKSVRNFQ